MAEITQAVNNTTYDENQIQVLEGLEAVRKRPGMYIGSTSQRGMHHLIYEIVDNSIDEALAGACTEITVRLLPDGSAEISDNGRGIPAAMHRTGKPTPEVVFTVLHAGGKFRAQGYVISGGLHGVGASVVNALSTYLSYTNCFEGKEYTQSFERGKVVNEFTCTGNTSKHGLTVRFLPDHEIFEEFSMGFDYNVLLSRLREQSFLNAGIKIIFRDERCGAAGGKSEEIIENVLHYEGGIKSFVSYLNTVKTCHLLHDDVIYMKAVRDYTTAEVAIQYNDSYNDLVMTFANNINTIDGGMHETGFKTALTKVINAYARKTGQLKDADKNLSGEDCREGICAVVSVKLQDAQFEGQTKTKLGNSEMRVFVDNLVTEKLGEFFEENPSIAKAILEKCLEASRAREAARKAKESARRKSVLEGTALPGQLWDCQEKRVDVTELFLVEGRSAGGSAKDGRNSRYQAILPMRGKVLNVEKSRLDKVYSNTQLIPIIQALGCGIGSEFDITKLRYGKIIIMADADVDGSHIQILLLTFFFRHMRKLIEDGHIYLACPPLFKVFRGKEERYAFNEEERDLYIAELANGDPSKVTTERYKGLGEMDPDQLRLTTMDPRFRTLRKVTIEDAIESDTIFSLLMGDEVEPRREFIEQNAKYADNLDV